MRTAAETAQAIEAPILEEDSDGVRMMTVHKAKGLEFPIVILADLTCRLSRADAGRWIDPSGSICAIKLGGWAPTDLLLHGGVEAARDRAEGERLAYVAATRARDVLVVPGGWGTRALLEHRPVLDWISARGAAVPVLTSVCTGALLLGRVGLLDGRRATTHWRSLDLLREVAPRATVEDALHVVEDGHVLTSAGISAGIDMALRLVARLHGERIARETARHMEYPYPDTDGRRIPLGDCDACTAGEA